MRRGATRYEDETREQAIERLSSKYDRPPPCGTERPPPFIHLPRASAKDVEEEQKRMFLARYSAPRQRTPVYMHGGMLCSYEVRSIYLTIYLGDRAEAKVEYPREVKVVAGSLYVEGRREIGPPSVCSVPCKDFGFVDFDLMAGWVGGSVRCCGESQVARQAAEERLARPTLEAYGAAEALAAKKREYAVDGLLMRDVPACPRPIARAYPFDYQRSSYTVSEHCRVVLHGPRTVLYCSGKEPWKKYLDGAISWVISFTSPLLCVQYPDRWEAVDLEAGGRSAPTAAPRQLTHKGALVPTYGYASLVDGYVYVGGHVYA